MIKTSFRCLLILAVLYSPYMFADQLSFASDQIDTCNAIKNANPFIVDKHNSLYVVHESNNSQNPFIHVYLQNSDGCRVVLSTQGSGVDFIKNSKNVFPDVDASWHMGADRSVNTFYIWNGTRYVSREVQDSERLNKEALEYFNKGDLDRAIIIWEKAKDLAIIPGLGFTSNAEVLNNLGFAYYKLAKKTKNDAHYKRAEYYLDGTIQVDYKRWEAHLNLGDLYVEMNNPKNALQSYEKLLELNPTYKRADEIKAKITTLREKLKDEADKTYHVAINSKLPEFTITLSKEDDSMKIQVFVQNKLKQEFKCFDYTIDTEIEFKDINFDGYKDMMILSFLSANYGYTYWLFDPVSGTFIANDENTLWNPSFDESKKTLTTFWSGSDHSSTDVYSFINGKKILTKETRTEFKCNNKTFKCKKRVIEKILKDGEMMTVSDSTTDE
jgi:tetratricopeptide (TPR) repeat protein